MLLYGTVTSPFVRRVRVVAEELGLPVTMVDSSTADGQDRLRRLTPIWKVPIAEVDGQVIFDSGRIIEYLIEEHGHGSLRATRPATRVEERNLIAAIDGALEAAIRLFYVKRDGQDPGQIPYLAKERDRITEVMGWLDRRVEGGYCTSDRRFGLAELALYTSLAWMRFRDAYPVERHSNLVNFEAEHQRRPSLASTAPR